MRDCYCLGLKAAMAPAWPRGLSHVMSVGVSGVENRCDKGSRITTTKGSPTGVTHRVHSICKDLSKALNNIIVCIS